MCSGWGGSLGCMPVSPKSGPSAGDPSQCQSTEQRIRGKGLDNRKLSHVRDWDIPVAEAHILSLNRVIDVNRDVKCQQSRVASRGLCGSKGDFSAVSHGQCHLIFQFWVLPL